MQAHETPLGSGVHCAAQMSESEDDHILEDSEDDLLTAPVLQECSGENKTKTQTRTYIYIYIVKFSQSYSVHVLTT